MLSKIQILVIVSCLFPFKMTNSKAMEKLTKGLHNFQENVFPIQKEFFTALAHGQNPKILFISCSDSRIDPTLITSSGPGDLFVLRNAGDIVPWYSAGGGEAATIEYAVRELKVEHIIVCGHSHCGAVQAAFNTNKLSGQSVLESWINTYIKPTLTFVEKNYKGLNHKALSDVLLQEHVLKQLENLSTHPSVVQAIKNHTLTLHAWIYIFEDGDIYSFDRKKGRFEHIKHY